jgi:hypothetical protein
MALLRFYASRPDLLELFDWIYAEKDFRVFELNSGRCRRLREFKRLSDLDSARPLGRLGGAAVIALWAPDIMRSVKVRRIYYPEDGWWFETIWGGGLMCLHPGRVGRGFVTESQFDHHSEAGARWRARSLWRGTDWEAHRQLSNKFIYYVSKRLAVSRTGGAAVLRRADELERGGAVLKSEGSAPAYWMPRIKR